MTKEEIKRFGQSHLNINTILGSTIVAETTPLYTLTVSTALADGAIRVMSLWLRTAQIITGVKWVQTIQGNYTANNYNGVGLYTYSGGTMTQVAVSTDDGDIWKASAGMASKAFTSTYAAQPGLYFIHFLYNQSAQTTAPTLGCSVALGTSTTSAADYTNSAKFTGAQAGQTALGATLAMTSVTASTNNFYGALY